MRRILKLTILCCVFASGISYGEEKESPGLEEIKIKLQEYRNSDILIRHWEKGKPPGHYRFEFDDGTALIVPENYIRDPVAGQNDWTLELQFGDGTTHVAAYLDDIIPSGAGKLEVNPHGTSPLTALFTIDMPVAGSFVLEVAGKGPAGIPIRHGFEHLGRHHELQILGLYPGHENRVSLVFTDAEGRKRATKSLTIQTEPLINPPSIQIVKDALPGDQSDIYVLSELRGGFDRRGEIRWVYTGDGQYVLRRLESGNLLITSGQRLALYHSPAFYEVTMLGEVVRRYDVPNMLHHEVREMPNGNFLVATNSERFDGNGDDGRLEEGVVVEIDRATGSVIKAWDFNRILDASREVPHLERPDDRLHINGVYLDTADNSLVISSKIQSAIVKVDYQSGKVKWILAHPHGWSDKLKPFLLSPIGALPSGTDFYSYAQHAPLRLPNGNILLFDNGEFRNYYDGADIEDSRYSRAVEYRIDEERLTVELVWEFTYDKKLYTRATGDVDYFPGDGHRLIGFLWGSEKTPKIVELNEDGEIVFEADINTNTTNYYRVEKFGLYDGL